MLTCFVRQTGIPPDVRTTSPQFRATDTRHKMATHPAKSAKAKGKQRQVDEESRSKSKEKQAAREEQESESEGSTSGNEESESEEDEGPTLDLDKIRKKTVSPRCLQLLSGRPTVPTDASQHQPRPPPTRSTTPSGSSMPPPSAPGRSKSRS